MTDNQKRLMIRGMALELDRPWNQCVTCRSDSYEARFKRDETTLRWFRRQVAVSRTLEEGGEEKISYDGDICSYRIKV